MRRGEQGGILLGSVLVILAWAILILNVLRLGGDQALLDSGVIALVIGGLGFGLVMHGRPDQAAERRDPEHT